jgi:[ribosomal protein S18]-alanine N-acetyltransferase
VTPDVSARGGLRIRDFRPDDLEAAYELDQRCFDREIAYTRGQIRAFLSRPGAIGLIAESHGRLSGFAIGESAGSRGHVVTIDVDASDRRRGAGKQLLAELLRRLAAGGVREVRLEVDLRNAAAIRFYERMGFREKRRLPDYYGPGLDGMRMVTDVRKREAPAPQPPQ